MSKTADSTKRARAIIDRLETATRGECVNDDGDHVCAIEPNEITTLLETLIREAQMRFFEHISSVYFEEDGTFKGQEGTEKHRNAVLVEECKTLKAELDALKTKLDMAMETLDDLNADREDPSDAKDFNAYNPEHAFAHGYYKAENDVRIDVAESLTEIKEA